MIDDLRLAARLLLKDKAFTLTAALTLAICIGANTTLFSVVHNVLLAPLPVPESDRILLMGNAYPKAGADTIGNSGVPDYYDRLRDMKVFEEQAAFTMRTRSIDERGTPTRVTLVQATPSFFRLVRVPPALGRIFTEEEGEIGHEKEVILSHGLWKSQFGGDPAAIGKDLRIDGVPHTVVGVMPPTFVFFDPEAVMWVPLAFTPEQKSDDSRHSNNWHNIGRLKPGATIEQAQAQVDAINAANLDRFPQYRELLINAGFHTVVIGLKDFLVRDIRPVLYLMWGGALFVLLIGAVNVANLVLVRSRARLKELATRLALGAGQGRLVRQVVVESLLLTTVSAAAGLFLGYATLRLLGTINIQDLPRGQEIRVDGATVAYALGLASLIGCALGVIPVLSLRRSDLTIVLREEGRTGTSGTGARNLRRALVVAQVGFAYVLLIGAGLLFASFRKVLAVDPGFRGQGVMTATVVLPATRYKDDPAVLAFADEALRRLRALPGVTGAGATDTIPFGGGHSDSVILAEGYQMQPGESLISPSKVVATPGYFETIGARLVAGRFFEERDDAKATRVAVVDEKLAKHFWPGADPIGRRLYLPDDINNLLAITDKTIFVTVVGVVHDVKLESLTEGRQAVGTYYFPLAQSTENGLTFALRTAGDPASLSPALRGALQGLDRELPVFDMTTLDALTQRSLLSRRAPVLLSLSFGAVALFLSALGIYGVLAYLVTQRTREIAIRLALGSSAGGVFNLVLREGLWLSGAGFLLGLAGSAAVRRAVESQLFGISATDPLVLVFVTIGLGLVAMAACALPARRATRIDPILALSE
ncbi:MAG TPA: ABC transporter permease [Candidatus Polarisedimenticolia bacterium]|nr:ABC transporter permease [Candidatus Polarisedimenticolia bacterium]